VLKRFDAQPLVMGNDGNVATGKGLHNGDLLQQFVRGLCDQTGHPTPKQHDAQGFKLSKPSEFEYALRVERRLWPEEVDDIY
jgi:hypothetical protein